MLRHYVQSGFEWYNGGNDKAWLRILPRGTIELAEAKRLDDYGFHSFRRFRITHLEAVRAHGHLTKIWAGHSLGNDITSEYAKSLKENLSLRLEEAEKVGIGFALPAPSCSKISGAQAVAVAA